MTILKKELNERMDILESNIICAADGDSAIEKIETNIK
jgi:hypothetical protein